MTIPASIASIADNMFSGCTGLTSVTIQSGVASLGNQAFQGCSGLTAAYFLGNAPAMGANVFGGTAAGFTVYYFNGATGFTWPTWDGYAAVNFGYTVSNGAIAITSCTGIGGAVNIPASLNGLPVTGIGSSAFSSGDVTSVTIPASVTTIATDAFAGSSLSAITVVVGNLNFSGSNGVLFNANQTTLIKCPVFKPGNYQIPSSVTTIGAYAFQGCASLTGVTIPSGVTSIGTDAFYGCTGLTGITIPNSVTGIGAGAFEACANLASIAMATPNAQYSSVNGVLFNNNQTTLIQYPAGIQADGYTIPSSVTTIGDGAFYQCYNLKNVTIPDSVTTIGNGAFYECYGLIGMTVPVRVTAIGNYAFYSCANLAGVTIPNSVLTIGEGAFYGCSSLTGITLGSGVASIGKWAFDYCQSLAGTFFKGAAPTMGADVFASTASGFTVYYVNGATGFTSPTWDGYPAQAYAPPTITIGSPLPDAIVSTAYSQSLTASGGIPNYTWSVSGGTLPAGLSLGGSGWLGGTAAAAGVYTFTVQVTDSTGGTASRSMTLTVESLPPYTYTIANGQITITGYTGAGGAVDIPATINPGTGSLPVTGIASYAFDNDAGLTSVTIPASVTGIGTDAFYFCANLTAITMIAANSQYSTVNGVLFDNTRTTLIQCPGGMAGSYAVPSGVTSIADDAFKACASLTAITIPSGVTSIGNLAFLDCTKLAGITIPPSVTTIGTNAFGFCTSLTAITMAAPNSQFSSVSGVLFNNNQTTLIQCPGGMPGSYTIPSGVTTIGSGAFNGCASLTGVTIPASVTSIGSSAFESCTGLTAVTIPSGVTNIGSYAFNFCSSLKKAIFMGNAPASVGTGVFDYAGHGFSVYYLGAATGFTSPVWNGYTAQVYAPPVITSGPALPGGSVGTAYSQTLTASGGIPNYTWSISGGTLPAGLTVSGAGVLGGIPTATGNNNFTLQVTDFTGTTATRNISISIQNPFTYTIANGQVTITGYTGSGGILGIPATINGLPVTAIANYAFQDCTTITGMTIPSGVTSIGNSAFSGCSGLASVTIPGNVSSLGFYAFAYCSSLTNVTIPGSITSIGIFAFLGCTGLTGVTIPSSVTSIGADAFNGCTGLTSVTIPGSVTSIGDAAFEFCSGLKSAVLTGNAPSLGQNVFAYAASGFTVYYATNATGFTSPTWHGYTVQGYAPLTITTTSPLPVAIVGTAYSQTLTASGGFPNYAWSVSGGTLPTGLTLSGGGVLSGTAAAAGAGNFTLQVTDSKGITATQSVSLSIQDTPYAYTAGGGTATITGYAGGGGTVKIPATINGLPVTAIGDYAFYGSASLTSVTIPSGVTSIGAGAFSSCGNLASVTIPNSVTGIATQAFSFCPLLSSLTIPGSVTSIGDYAFVGCGGLTNLTINYGVTSIGYDAFGLCGGLTGVTIPASVTSIGGFGFNGCGNLRNVIFTGNAPSVGSYAFTSTASGFTVSYYDNSGFTSPTWNGYMAFSLGAPPAPATPAGLTAAPGTGTGQILINWSASTWAQTYILQRSASPVGGYLTLATVSGTTYTDTIPTPTPGQTYYYQIAAAGTGGTSAYGTTASATPFVPPTFGGWAYGLFGLNAPASEAGAMATPANDGITNLMKYALALDPMSCGTGALPTVSPQNGYLTLTYRKNKQATDMAYTVQAADSLNSNSWTPATTVTSQSDQGTYTLVTVRDTVPLAGHRYRFMRMLVSQ